MEFTRADAAHLRDAVAMVKHGQTLGTGFFVAPGLMLTCEHVIHGASPDAISVHWNGMKLTVDQLALPALGSDLDAALLTLSTKTHPILELGPATTVIAPVYSYGFQFSERGYSGYPSLGSIAGFVREGTSSTQRELLHIVNAIIAPGLSGAPLYSLIDRRVVGMVKRNRPEGGGYAVPIEQVRELKPDLLSLTSAAHIKAHQSPLEAYFRRLAAAHEFVALMDLQRSLRLEDIFVSLTLTRSGVNGQRLAVTTGGQVSISTRQGSTLRMARRDKGSPQRFGADLAITLFEVISYPKVIIIGEPGSGKTTLLRHIVSRTCKGELLRDRVPIFLKLADLQTGVGCVEEWLRATQSNVSDVLLTSLELRRLRAALGRI